MTLEKLDWDVDIGNTHLFGRDCPENVGYLFKKLVCIWRRIEIKESYQIVTIFRASIETYLDVHESSLNENLGDTGKLIRQLSRVVSVIVIQPLLNHYLYSQSWFCSRITVQSSQNMIFWKVMCRNVVNPLFTITVQSYWIITLFKLSFHFVNYLNIGQVLFQLHIMNKQFFFSWSWKPRR